MFNVMSCENNYVIFCGPSMNLFLHPTATKRQDLLSDSVRDGCL